MNQHSYRGMKERRALSAVWNLKQGRLGFIEIGQAIKTTTKKN
jgi:hypothetical protein